MANALQNSYITQALAPQTVAATTEMAPAGASLIEARDIKTYDRLALSEALSLAPGVSFSRIGQRNETTVYVRGFDIRQVPVFIDGSRGLVAAVHNRAHRRHHTD
jgi:outer membrane cobalamin receptor